VVAELGEDVGPDESGCAGEYDVHDATPQT
jgi:hypothetical protein